MTPIEKSVAMTRVEMEMRTVDRVGTRSRVPEIEMEVEMGILRQVVWVVEMRMHVGVTMEVRTE